MKTLTIQDILDEMQKLFPAAKTELNYSSDFQFVVAVILSAQSTDVQVNKVTQKLFLKIKTPNDVIDMGEDSLKEEIKSIGFFNNKAKNILKLSQILSQKNSQIPQTLDELMTLPGIGLKTAKLVLAQLFGQSYIPVDTHIHRISNRLGIVDTLKPDDTSKLLENLIPDNRKKNAHHFMIFFGRYFCKAQKPKCETCPFTGFCKFYNLKK